MAYETKDNEGALFRARDRKSDKHPEFTGNAVIDGRDYWLSAWVNESKKDGSKYFSIKFRAKDDAGQARQPAKETRNSYAEAKGKPATAAPTYAEELDDEIPF